MMSYSPENLLLVSKRLVSFVQNYHRMDIQKLESDLVEILSKKAELNKTDYNDAAYDEAEEAIHDLEDQFLENYGDFMEDALHEVHDEFCPDSDVLLPIAYIPNRFEVKDGKYTVPFSEGVYVDVDDYESNNTKLVLLPGPLRIELLIEKDHFETVWKPKEQED